MCRRYSAVLKYICKHRKAKTQPKCYQYCPEFKHRQKNMNNMKTSYSNR